MIAPLHEFDRGQVERYLLEHWGLPEAVTAWKYYDQRFNDSRPEALRGLVWAKDDALRGFLGLLPFQLAGGGERHAASWLVDWSLASKETSPGMGVMLMRKAVQACGIALSLGGSADTLSILPRMAALTVEDAGCLLRKRLRLGTALDRFAGTRLAPLGHASLRRLPLPAFERVSARFRVEVETGVSPRLGELLERLCPPPASPAWRPCYDFEYLHWLIGRCPLLESATLLAGGAAGLLWHPRQDTRFWRIALFQAPETSGSALGAILQGARDMVYSRGGWELWATVSHREERLLTSMRKAGYRLMPKRVPLFVCTSRNDLAVQDFAALNYLDTDRGYRF